MITAFRFSSALSLSAPVSPDRFESMLVSFLDLARTCEAQNLSLQRVSFKAGHIFYDPSLYSLRFLYLPVRGQTGSLSSPLEALEHLAKGAKITNEPTRTLASQVLDYALRSLLFSWTNYEGFLRTQGVLEVRDHGNLASSFVGAEASRPGDRRDQYGFDFMGAQACILTPRPGAPCLVRLEDSALWPLKEGSTVIGAAAGCTLRLQGLKGLSRRHAALQLTAQGCQLMDLGSTNGVRLNGQRIPAGVPVTVQEGDRIQLARTLFTVRGVPC